MRSRRLLWIALAGGLILGACGPGFDEFTGGDGTRGEAREVAIDSLLDDRVSADEGDHTDWKTFEMDDAARVSVKVWWDDPGLSAQIAIRDELGQQIKAFKHVSGQRAEVLGPVSLEEGVYFLEFTAKSGSSVYTYEIETGGGGGTPVPDF